MCWFHHHEDRAPVNCTLLWLTFKRSPVFPLPLRRPGRLPRQRQARKQISASYRFHSRSVNMTKLELFWVNVNVYAHRNTFDINVNKLKFWIRHVTINKQVNNKLWHILIFSRIIDTWCVQLNCTKYSCWSFHCIFQWMLPGEACPGV